jgi:hypothetical protein
VKYIYLVSFGPFFFFCGTGVWTQGFSGRCSTT